MPEPALGVSLVQTKEAHDTALFRHGSLEMRVSGHWATKGTPELTVQYRNAGFAAVTIGVNGFTMSRAGQQAALWDAEDMTGVDLTDGNSSNDNPDVLVDEHGHTVAPLRLRAGETRSISVGFKNFQIGPGVGPDQSLTAGIAVPDGAVPLRFKTVSG